MNNVRRERYCYLDFLRLVDGSGIVVLHCLNLRYLEGEELLLLVKERRGRGLTPGKATKSKANSHNDESFEAETNRVRCSQIVAAKKGP